MSNDYKTLRVPEDAWETAKTQKESAGRTWGEQVVQPYGGLTKIPCGCGDYAVYRPEGRQADSIDVMCPACGDHFGHGLPDDGDNGSTTESVDVEEITQQLKQEIDSLAFQGGVTDSEAERIIGRINDLEAELPAKIRRELER